MWVIHPDVDEFLHVDPPGVSSLLPVESEDGSWDFPIYRWLKGKLEVAECVPLARIMFPNHGVRDLRSDQLVVKEHVVRERLGPSWKAWGKVSSQFGAT